MLAVAVIFLLINTFDIKLKDGQAQASPKTEKLGSSLLKDIEAYKKKMEASPMVAGTKTRLPQATSQIANLVELCEADAASFKADAKLKWNVKIKEEVNKYNDPVMKAAFENLMQSNYDQYEANINLMASSQKTWCIEHNRNYSGYVAPDAKIALPNYPSGSPLSECMKKSNCTYGCSVPDYDVEYVLNTIATHKRELEISIAAGGYQQEIWEEALNTDFARYESYCGKISN